MVGASRRAPFLHSLRTPASWAPGRPWTMYVSRLARRPACRVADVWFSSPLGTESAVVYSALKTGMPRCRWSLEPDVPKILQLQKSGDKQEACSLSGKTKFKQLFFSHWKRWCICMSENTHTILTGTSRRHSRGHAFCRGRPVALHRPCPNAARCLSCGTTHATSHRLVPSDENEKLKFSNFLAKLKPLNLICWEI